MTGWAFAVAVVVGILAVGFTLFQGYQPPEQACGVENCHGLQVLCGPDPVEVCTEEYALGDGCRPLANCQIVSGSCQLVDLGGFEKCRNCVESCLLLDDPILAFDCERTCVGMHR